MPPHHRVLSSPSSPASTAQIRVPCGSTSQVWFLSFSVYFRVKCRRGRSYLSPRLRSPLACGENGRDAVGVQQPTPLRPHSVERRPPPRGPAKGRAGNSDGTFSPQERLLGNEPQQENPAAFVGQLGQLQSALGEASPGGAAQLQRHQSQAMQDRIQGFPQDGHHRRHHTQRFGPTQRHQQASVFQKRDGVQVGGEVEQYRSESVLPRE